MPRKQTNAIEAWLRYDVRTPDCVPLDREAYPGDVYEGRPVPWPPWACRAPDGGIHKDSRIGQIDVHIATPPKKKDEISWTCEFQVKAWLCYACRTANCAPLDRDLYAAGVYEGRPIPLPPWVCRSPDGGLHKDNRVGQIDVHLSAPPKIKDEISWTCDFGVRLISRRWLEQIEDLIDPSKTFVGRAFLKGKELTDWVTLHEPSPPLLMMREGWRKSCPICGQDNSVMYSGMFFADPTTLGRRVIVSGDDIFVRKEDAEARGLKPPAGGFKPVRIRYRPEWVAQMRLRDPPDFTSRT